MNWKNLLVPPVAIYVANFMFISALIGFQIDQTATWVWIVNIIITIVGLWIATNMIKPASVKDGLMLGIGWIVIMLILDLVLTTRFTGMTYFSDWKSYIPYILTILIPVVNSKK